MVSTTYPTLTLLNGSAAIGAQFTTPIELNKVNPARLIIGGSNAAYESLDRGASVTALTPISPISPVNGTFTGKPIAYGGYLAGVPNADVLYYGSNSTVKVRTTAGGSIASTAAAFPGATVQDIVLDPNDWQHVFVAGSSSVYVSTNVGASWTNITGDLTGVGSIHTLEFFKLNGADCVAAGTDIGVFCSFTSSLGTWFRLGTGMPNAVVYDMQYNAVDKVLVAGTMGRSTFLLSVPQTPTITTPTSASLTATTAALGGNVTSDSGLAITERGVVYSVTAVNPDPLIGGTGVTKFTSAGTTGIFTVNVTGLTQGTGYSFKAYATNSAGTTYTTPVSTFTTLVAAPVTGTKTLGSGGDYTSLTNSGGLFEAINGNGVNGALSVQVISNLTAETGTVALNALSGTTP